MDNLELLKLAHKYCSNHRDKIKADTVCGCFYCKKIFKDGEIKDWLDKGQTAHCPFCGIDSVIYNNENFEINENLLSEMKKYWFW